MTITSSKRCCSNKWSGTGELYPCQDSYIKMNDRNTFENPLLLLLNLKSVEIMFFSIAILCLLSTFLVAFKWKYCGIIKSHERAQKICEDSICWFYIWSPLLACLQVIIRSFSGKYINCKIRLHWCQMQSHVDWGWDILDSLCVLFFLSIW